MIFERFFKPREAVLTGRALYASAVDQARNPWFYARLGVPDTPLGRFEIYSLHVVLLLRRMKGGGDQAQETAQALFDTYVSALDHGLRELGVGDLSVGKKMKKLAGAFYGRIKAYETALDAADPAAPLRELIGRTVYADAPDRAGGEAASELAAYVLDGVAVLDSAPLEAVLAGRAFWPPIEDRA